MRKKKGTWGGYRPGSGKKRSTDPISTYAVRITMEQAEKLKEWGAGDISAGLRWLITAAEPFVGKTEPKGIVAGSQAVVDHYSPS